MTVECTAQLDALRRTVGRVEALAAVAEESFGNANWCSPDQLQIDRMSHVISSVAEAAAAAVAAVDRFESVLADQQSAPAGDDWGER